MAATTRSPKHPPMHPGEFLREVTLPAIDLTTTEVAERLGVSGQTLLDILEERSGVTAEIALRFGKFFGNGPDLWINLQKQYEMMVAERDMADELARIETIRQSEPVEDQEPAATV